MVPEGSFIIKPEQFMVDLGQDLDAADLTVPSHTILRSPHLLSIGKAILEIAKSLQELQEKSCPADVGSCPLPRFDTQQERRSMSNVELYEALRVPAKSHSTRYVYSVVIQG